MYGPALLTYALWTVAGILLAFGLFLVYVRFKYLGIVSRIFEEQPIFVVPHGQPQPGSEDVRFNTSDGLSLAGSYLHTSAPRRRGLILFGCEFGSNRWSCVPYCEGLLANGYDIFAFDFCNQGESDAHPGYQPLQWVTDYEVRDMRAAIAYLKQRPDAPADGIGLFGISRGGCAAILTAAGEPWIHCVVTDGAFATRTTMVPYMEKWVSIYSPRLRLEDWVPRWVFFIVASIMLRVIGKRRKCRYPSLKKAIARIHPRPLFMIHGGADTYIKPPSAQELFDRARPPKAFWLVEGAKHNQALTVAGDSYSQQLLGFFDRHLANGAHDWSVSGRANSAQPEPVAAV